MGDGWKSPGLVPFTRKEVHEKIVQLLSTEQRGKLLDVPTGSGVLAGRLQKMGFDVSCCDIQPSFFEAQDLTVQLGDMNKRLPYKAECFDYIICLEDGKKFKSLKRHLRTHYNLTPEEYRAKWGLPHDYPMVAPNYAKARSDLAKKMGLGTKRE